VGIRVCRSSQDQKNICYISDSKWGASVGIGRQQKNSRKFFYALRLPRSLYIRAMRVPHIKLTANRVMAPVLVGLYAGMLPGVIFMGVVGFVFYTTLRLWDDGI
jgi:hypothetical protein